MTLSDSQPTEDPGGLTVRDQRAIQAGLVARSSAGVPRAGIFPAHTGQLVVGTAGTGYTVLPFAAATSRDGVGIERVVNDAATAVPSTAGPQSNRRLDVIWMRSRFPSLTDAGQTVPLFGVTQGEPAQTPQKPSIPPGALELAVSEVESTDTSTNQAVITQTYPFTALAGGTVLLRNQQEMDAWTPGDGAEAFRLDLGQTVKRSDGAWIVPQSGTAEGSQSGGIVQKGGTAQLLTFTVPAVIPKGATLHISAEVELYYPPGGVSYAGNLLLRRGAVSDGTTGTTVLQQRRWHSHGRGGRSLTIGIELNLRVQSTIAAGQVFSLASNSDSSSDGGVEAWYAFAAWEVS